MGVYVSMIVCIMMLNWVQFSFSAMKTPANTSTSKPITNRSAPLVKEMRGKFEERLKTEAHLYDEMDIKKVRSLRDNHEQTFLELERVREWQAREKVVEGENNLQTIK